MSQTGQSVRVGGDLADRRTGPVGPDAVHQVFAGDQGDATALETLVHLPDMVGRVEPGIEPHTATGGQMLAQPGRGFHIGPVDGGEMICVDLHLDLNAVATIDKDARLVRQRDTESRRAGEPREPGQTLIARGDILALMRIGPRHEVAGEPLRGHRLAQCRQARRTLRRVRGFGKTLKHSIPPGG